MLFPRHREFRKVGRARACVRENIERPRRDRSPPRWRAEADINGDVWSASFLGRKESEMHGAKLNCASRSCNF